MCGMYVCVYVCEGRFTIQRNVSSVGEEKGEEEEEEGRRREEEGEGEEGSCLHFTLKWCKHCNRKRDVLCIVSY